MLYSLLLLTFLLATGIQIFYYLFFFKRLADYDCGREKFPLSAKEDFPADLIICAKNEEKNLVQNIPRILNQNDRLHKLLVVNDNSDDKSLYILKEIQKKSPTFDIINLTHTKSGAVGKKYALSVGIKNADADVLLLTDADCEPLSNDWVGRMKAGLGDKEIGLGYSPYAAYPGLLNLFIRYEAVWTAVQYLSFALAGLPYMGVGRNLIYRKELFARAGGFAKHAHIPTGDDDLFINAVARADNTTVILHPDTFILSEPKRDWRSYVRQKRRHLSAGVRYRLRHQILLGLLSATHFLHYTSGIALAFFDITIFFTLLAVRLSVVLWIYRRILKKLNDPKMWLWIPFLDFAYLFFYLFFATALMNTNKTWN